MFLKIGSFILFLSILYQLFFTNNVNHYFKNYFSPIELTEQLPICMANVYHEYDLIKFNHLAIFGHVFDVSSRQDLYGVNGSYTFFTGKDSSRAFGTGDFSVKGLTADIQGLSNNEIGEIFRWLLYMKSNYKCIGHVPGLYFHVLGEYTDYMKDLINSWKTMKERYDQEQLLYPSCNYETYGEKIKISCPKSANRIKTYPRKLRLSGTTKHRCTCLELKYHDTRIQYYEGCDYYKESCLIDNN